MIFNKMNERHGVINSLADMEFIAEHNVLTVHCIDLIEKIQDANVTKLSKVFRLTRGAISKLAKRLIKAGIIEAYQKPENKITKIQKDFNISKREKNGHCYYVMKPLNIVFAISFITFIFGLIGFSASTN